MENSSQNLELFEALREKRNELAKREDRKPYMILHNKALEEIAKRRPRNLDELLEIKGIGSKKVKQYGQMILDTTGKITGILVDNRNKKEKIFTVSEFIDFLNEVLVARKAIVQGEVGKVDERNGYGFFTLHDKDEEAVLNCFIWQNRLDRSGIELKEGLEIKVSGFPEVYKRTGRFNFQVEQIGLVGEGALKQAFEALKRKLAQARFFDPSLKKPIPKFCQKIGLITSQFADAKKDFLKHLGNFDFQIYFYDVHVEGLHSIDEIVHAIHWFNENMLDMDVLVITRGGGSWESLQSFNSEAVAKAVFASKIPVICGVGHEADETIVDWVADKRASTPTHAAKILSDPWKLAISQLGEFQKNIFSSIFKICKETSKELDNFKRSFNEEIKNFLDSRKNRVNYLTTNLNLSFQGFFKDFDKTENSFLNNFQMFQTILREKQSEICQLSENLDQKSSQWIDMIGSFLKDKEERFTLVNPEFRLKQGYSITFSEPSGKVIKTVNQLKKGSRLKTKFYQGSTSSRVEKISNK